MTVEQFAYYLMRNNASLDIHHGAASGDWCVNVNALAPSESIWGEDHAFLQGALNAAYEACLARNNWRPYEA